MNKEDPIQIPVEAMEDPFCHPNNIKYLEQKLNAYCAGQLEFEQHDLIEIED